MAKAKRKGSFIRKVIVAVFLLLVLIGGGVGYHFYSMIYQPNVVLGDSQEPFFYVHTGDEFNDVVNRLYEQNYIVNRSSFEWVAERKNYPNKVQPGRYRLQDDMNNEQLVDLLRSGVQEPVVVTFNNIRTKDRLAGRVAKFIEADSTSLASLFNDPDTQAKYGFTSEAFIAMFVPNTYELMWNTSAEQFVERMAQEFKDFWTDERKAKAKKLGLTQSQVVTLASIVQSETSKVDEMPRVAGVYLNRIKKDMLLQADPTLVFAHGDFSIRRVLNKHKEIDSRYNTYKYKGLPPGPIAMANINTIDAVLSAEDHSYLYFCAKDDFSGYHAFAQSYSAHKKNARKYQRALNQRNIYN